MKALSFFKSVETLKDTVLRFPLSTLCALITFFLIALSLEKVKLFDDQILHARMIGLFISGFFWCAAAQLFRESHSLSNIVYYSLTVTGFLALTAMWLMSGILQYQAPLIGGALFLLIFSAPYILNQRSPHAFWVFQHTLGVGASFGFLAAMILWGGVSAALASIAYLFELKIDWRFYVYIWVFAAILLGPLYTLSWAPDRFDDEAFDPNKGLKFILNWILAPLVIVYMVILYAYFVKIGVTQELPRGQMANMTIGFAAAGIVTYATGWPLREEGGFFLRTAVKWFFPALIIPILMQALAIGVRIDAYGLTEKRYLVCLAAVWFAVLAVLFTLKKNIHLKVIPLVLIVLLLLASFGPWSAYNLSGWSQTKIVERLMTENGILQDGKIVESTQDIPLEDRARISSIIRYMYETRRMDTLAGWIDASEKIDVSTLNANKYIARMGFEFVHEPYSYNRKAKIEDPQRKFNLRSLKQHNIHVVTGYDYVIPQTHIIAKKDGSVWSRHWPETGLKAFFSENGVLTLTLRDKKKIAFDVAKYARGLADSGQMQYENLMLEKDQNGLRVKVLFPYMSVEISGGLTFHRLSFIAYVDER